MDNIDKIISARRKELGMTQAELALRLNVSDKTVSKWETGASLPDIVLIKVIAEVLEISINQLLGETEDNQQNHSYESAIDDGLKEEVVVDKRIAILLKMQRLIEYILLFATITLLIIPYVLQINAYHNRTADLSIAFGEYFSQSQIFALIFLALFLPIYALLTILTFVLHKPGAFKNSLFYHCSVTLFLLAMFMRACASLNFLSEHNVISIIKTLINMAAITLPFLPFFVAKKCNQKIKKDKRNKLLFIIAAAMIVIKLSTIGIEAAVLYNFFGDANSVDRIFRIAISVTHLIDSILLSVAIICHFIALNRVEKAM